MARRALTRLQCPECGCKGLFKDGKRHLSTGEKIQRFLCRACGYRFSEKPISPKSVDYRRQLCVFKEAKKLDPTTETKTVAGERKPTQEIEIAGGKIVELIRYMERQGYSFETIRLNRIALKVLIDRGANLFDSESVKEVMAKQK